MLIVIIKDLNFSSISSKKIYFLSNFSKLTKHSNSSKIYNTFKQKFFRIYNTLKQIFLKIHTEKHKNKRYWKEVSMSFLCLLCYFFFWGETILTTKVSKKDVPSWCRIMIGNFFHQTLSWVVIVMWWAAFSWYLALKVFISTLF